MEIDLPAASVEAYRQLMALNRDAHKPEVADWLRSAEAEEVLAHILFHVPCPPTLH